MLLERFSYSPDETLGVISIGEFECFTIERPWLDNRRGRSCIPEGVYPIRVGTYYRGGYPCVELDDVPGRTLIKMHAANRARELQGCIAPGMAIGALRGERAVLQSRTALQQILDSMSMNTEDTLTVLFRCRYGPARA